MAKFEVIIPYFQRKPGLLLRALKSVFAQDVKDLKIIVVDDGSPRCAHLDMAALPAVEQARVKLIRQKNAGATAARNRALENISEDAQYVAFLDSDDEWMPDHLARAAKALRQTDAVLFHDAIEIDQGFAEGYAAASSILDQEDVKILSETPKLMRVDTPLNVMAGEWFRHLHLSVTVIRADLARSTRFSKSFQLAEDFEFFCQCAIAGGRWVIDEEIGARRGDGLNIWHGTETSDKRYSQEKYFTLRALKKLQRTPELQPKTRQKVSDRIALYREQFYWAQRARLRANKPPNLDLWIKLLVRDPGAIAFVLSHLVARSSKSPAPASD
ncbi:MAG: glycosyltransferase family A protein [Pseudomonadota bacterium]